MLLLDGKAMKIVKQSVFRIICGSLLVVLLSISGLACSQPPAGSQAGSQKIALEFVKSEATYRFDGIADTLKEAGSTAMGDGWVFTIRFDSRNAGYGDRGGQVLAAVITPHSAEVTVQSGKVTAASLDGRWDMINQRVDVEIKLAPIDAVNVSLLKSNPPQINVHIKGGLPDGCTTFHDIETSREGSTVNIKVTVQRPAGVSCPAIYTSFEKDVNLGSDFAFGTTYTLKVNDYNTTFSGTLMQAEGFAIYLTKEDVPPGKMEALSSVAIAAQPVIAIRDIVSYNAQTYQIKLTDEAYARVYQLEVPVRGKTFVVCVDKTPVYWGAFWTPISSLSFDGVTIWKPLGSQESKIITLELGYPAPSFYSGQDPRDNPRVLEALKQAGKLVSP